jgi:predicted transcriptional regulator
MEYTMPTTSLKLPEDVKELAQAAAKRQGVSTHSFMVDAIRTMATAAEKRAAFVADALAARDEAYATGKADDAEEVHAWLLAKVKGKPATKPKLKNWRR